MTKLSFHRRSEREIQERARSFFDEMKARRTVRDFSDEPIPEGVLENCLMAAATAPNGANLQPWTFVVVQDPEIKKRIREAAEEEEREFYAGRANEEWLQDLAPLGTDASKPFLEKAPALIAVFMQNWGIVKEGSAKERVTKESSAKEVVSEPIEDVTKETARKQHYYVKESVGIACGFLIAALHQAGLATLTHTPSPMKFLGDILERPENEKPFLLLVTGFPSDGAEVPDITKKKTHEIIIWK
jgi:nitroreductase